ncbi:UvrB/UvrC motif-containing protein [Numidum massiliense]|uniref:UvrB/UvrC motif-containing protein n=1 Tax=Numidum massiliense TaxID=1522315 RepID=UPI0006D5ADBD|nr:UvrB/UvrC motif-containing protein [Numidum massiliense]
MLCQECGKRPATLHFTKIVNGEKTEFHICEPCAKEKGEFLPDWHNGFSIHNLLAGMLNTDFFDADNRPRTGDSGQLRCETCGMTYQQFSKIGRFGCSDCYHYFEPVLEPLIRRVHGNTQHSGKLPARRGEHLKRRRELSELKQRLAQLVAKEEFEEAAHVRDRIRELERDQ